MPRYNPEQPIGTKKGGLKPFKAHFTEHDGEHEYHTDGLVWARTWEAALKKARRLLRQWWGENDMKPCRDLSGKIDPDSFEEIYSGRVVVLGTVRELVTLGDLVQCIGVIE